MRRTLLPIIPLLALTLASCGTPDDAIQDTAMTSPDATPDLGTKPDVTVPTETPDELLVADLVAGTGDEATPGRTVIVHYVGVSQATGKQFDASWDRGQTFSFVLGEGRVIAGWDHGVAGMRVGGRRQLVIPSDLAYGERGAGGVIGPNETLVFVVDLLEVR